jgi:hypothetical protein
MDIFHLQIVVSSYLSNLMLGPKVQAKKNAIRKGKQYFSATARILKYEQIKEAPDALAT